MTNNHSCPFAFHPTLKVHLLARIPGFLNTKFSENIQVNSMRHAASSLHYSHWNNCRFQYDHCEASGQPIATTATPVATPKRIQSFAVSKRLLRKVCPESLDPSLTVVYRPPQLLIHASARDSQCCEYSSANVCPRIKLKDTTIPCSGLACLLSTWYH